MRTKAPRHLLVPTDVSPASLVSLRVAGALAERFGATITVLLVEPAGKPIEGEDASAAYYSNRRVVRALLGRLDGLPEFSIDVVGNPDEAQGIHAHAARIGADWICMSSAGKGGFARFLLGSVAESVVRTSTLPVLVVRAAKDSDTPRIDDGARVLVGVELDDWTGPVLEAATLLAGAGGEVVAVHALGDAADDRAGTDAATSARQRIEDHFHALQTSVRWSVHTPDGGAADELLDVAAKFDPAVTVVGTHGRRGFDRLRIGSVAETVLRGTSSPILVIPTRAEKA